MRDTEKDYRALRTIIKTITRTMKIKTATWFETTIKYEQVGESGEMKKVSETYAIDAMSFTEAEKTMTKEAEETISREYETTAIKIANYKEVLMSDDDRDDKYYLATLDFITTSDSGNDKHTKVNYLVQAATLDKAVKYVNDMMKDSMTDYKSMSVKETKVVDVLYHDSKE